MKTPAKKAAKKKTAAKRPAGSRGPRPRAKKKTPEEIADLKARLAGAVETPSGEESSEEPKEYYSPDLPDPDDDFVPEGCEPLGETPVKGSYRAFETEETTSDPDTGPFGGVIDTPEPPAPIMAHSATKEPASPPVAQSEATTAPVEEGVVGSLEHFIETLRQCDEALAFLIKKARALAPKDRRILLARRDRVQRTHAQLKVQLNARLQCGKDPAYPPA